MQPILATQTEAELNKVAKLADTISDTMTEKRHVAAVSNESIGLLVEQVALLVTKVGEIATGFQQELAALVDRLATRESRYGSGNPRHRSGHAPTAGTRYVDITGGFGADATRYEAPCRFRAGNDQGGH